MGKPVKDTPDNRDEPLSLPIDIEDALRGLLAVDRDDELDDHDSDNGL